MLVTILCCTLLLCGVGAELLISVLPAIVEPGVTPSFTLRCSLVEHEEGDIAALAVYRRAVTKENTPPELVAEILGTSPTIPSLVPGFERLTVNGQISQLEAEVESFLEVVWPNPGVQDLGLYSCEVTVLSLSGGVTTLVEARVTTSNAVTDRLLFAVQVLEQQVGVFNKTLQEINVDIVNITTVLDTEIRPAVESYQGDEKPVDATTEAVPTESTPLEEKLTTEASPSVETSEVEAPEEESPPPSSDADLERIVVELQDLKSKLEYINETLVRISDVITTLTVRGDGERETTAEKVPYYHDGIRTYFKYGNSSYVLLTSKNSTDPRKAQVACESSNLFLAEINDQEQLLSISAGITPHINADEVVLVGGQREFGQEDFVFQNSQQVVQFLTDGFQKEVEYPTGTCLALQTSPAGLTYIAVPCSSDDEAYHIYLCQQS